MDHPLDNGVYNSRSLSLTDFKLWSGPALRSILILRKKTTTGSHDELVAR